MEVSVEKNRDDNQNNNHHFRDILAAMKEAAELVGVVAGAVVAVVLAYRELSRKT